MSKINSKKKGNRGELECVKILNEFFDVNSFARVPSSGAWSGGQNRERRKDMSFEQKITLVADIMSPPNFEFVLEHKAYNEASFWDLFNEKSDLNSWLKQVEEDAEFVEKIPMLIVKYNRKKRIAYTTKKINNPVFIYGKWYCAFFDDVLKMDKSWWFQS